MYLEKRRDINLSKLHTKLTILTGKVLELNENMKELMSGLADVIEELVEDHDGN